MKLSVGIRNRSTARTALRSMNANSSNRARAARLCVRFATTASRALKKIACLRSIFAAAGLGLPQCGGEVGHLDEAKVCGDLPETLGELSDVEALGARDARYVGKFDRQRDDALLQRADLLDMA